MPRYAIIVLRSAGTFLVLLIIARLIGKRQISQMTFFDYIVGITIGSVAGFLVVDTSLSWIEILPAVLILGLLQIIFAYLSIRSMTFRKIVNGSPTVLIKNGEIIEKNLTKEKLSFEVLIAKLREKNAFNLADVEFAVLEPDGEVTVLLKSDKMPVTPSDLKLQTQYKGLPRTVIENGKIKSADLKDGNLSISWLMAKLSERGIYDVSNVSLAQVDSSGSLYVDLFDKYYKKLKDDRSGDMILANLEKIHADFLEYSLETRNETAKELYKQCETSSSNLISEFKKYIEQKQN